MTSNRYSYGYYISLVANGSVILSRGDTPIKIVTANVSLRTWHNVAVTITEQYTVTVWLDNFLLLVYTDPSPATNLVKGFIGLGTGWHQAQFDDVSITM